MRKGERRGEVTYATSDAEVRAEDRNKERDWDVYTTDDIAQPIDLVYGYTKLGGGWTKGMGQETREDDRKIPSVEIGPNQAHGIPVTKPRRTWAVVGKVGKDT